MRAEKPLKPKLNLSEFSITRWLLYNNYLVIGENNFAEFKSKNDKIAKKLFRKQFKEKILTIKKIKLWKQNKKLKELSEEEYKKTKF